MGAQADSWPRGPRTLKNGLADLKTGPKYSKNVKFGFPDPKNGGIGHLFRRGGPPEVKLFTKNTIFRPFCPFEEFLPSPQEKGPRGPKNRPFIQIACKSEVRITSSGYLDPTNLGVGDPKS